jgi:hypothetical protein
VLQLNADLPVLLVVGGSTGARSINRAVLANLTLLLQHCQIVHLSGQLDWPEVETAEAELPVELASATIPSRICMKRWQPHWPAPTWLYQEQARLRWANFPCSLCLPFSSRIHMPGGTSVSMPNTWRSRELL